MKKSSVSLMHRFNVFSKFGMSWKDESEPKIKYCLGRKIKFVQEFTTIQKIGQSTESRWNSSGIFSQDSPHWGFSVKSQNSWTKWTNPNNSKNELSSCQCSMTSNGEKNNETECIADATLESLLAKRFRTRRWSFVELGNRKNCAKKSIVSPSAQKCIDNILPLLLLSVRRDNGLVARKIGCPLSPNLIIIDSATLSHSPWGLSIK